MRAEKANHRVAVVVADGLSLFEFSVANAVFGERHNSEIEVPWYRLTVCSPDGAPVVTDRGLRLSVDASVRAVSRADTVVVAPNDFPERVPDCVLSALRRAHARGARIVSLCTGAMVLARTGLLDGRRITTHWQEADELARLHPDVTVDPGVLFVDDGDVLTSAGSAASMDLCLHIVRDDYGSAVATQLARELVVAPHRDGGQAQFIRTPMPEPGADDLFADTLDWMQRNLDRDLSVTALAQRSAMSRRTFARRFAERTGTTPHRWLSRQRVEFAQRLLEATDETVDVVAERSGFGTAPNLRKHFARVVHTSPAAYRRTFGGPQR